MRRRIAAVLRAAHRVVGLRRKRLALGSLAGAGGIAAMLASMMALLPLPARANTIPVSSSCTSGGTNGTVGRISMPNTADGAAGTGFPLAGGSGTFSLAAGCSATVDVSVLGGTAYGGYASVSGQGGVAVGFNSQAATWSLAAGLETRATSTGSTALGFGSQALSANAIAIGGAGGDGKTALSVANSTIANAAGSIAIGANASRGAQTGGTDSIAIGGQSTIASGATSGIALGRGSAVNNTGGVAVGDAATVSGNNGVALGINAKASNTGDVALGAGAQTSSVAVTTGTTINGQAYTFAGGAPQGTVSVGRQDGDKFYRTITNLGAGQLTATSQDAVNGSQLFATNQAVGSLASSTATTLGGGAAVSGGGIASFSVPLNNVGTTGAVSGTTTAQTTVGGALAALNTSVGNAANIAVKYDSVAGSTITLGATGGILPSKAPTVKITNLTAGALGSSSSDAVNGSQLYATNQSIANIQAGGGIKYFHANSTLADSSASGNDSLAIGPGATAYGNGAIAQGSSATAGVSGKAGTFTNDIAIGTSATSSGGNGLAIGANTVALGQSAVALGFGATASNTGDVALGAASTTAATIQTKSVSLNGTSYSFAGATPTNTVSIGQAGGERTLTNLAAGRLSASSTDAVNGSQLYATDQALGTLGALGPSVATALGAGASYDASTGKISGFSQPINGVDTVGAVGAPTNQTTMAGALTALNNNVANTASVAVKYDSATSPGQITLGAVGGTLPTGQGTVKITNLTVGTLGASSTDAVNGSQLYATNQSITNIQSGSGLKYFQASSTLAASNASGTNSVAIGPASNAYGDGSIAQGNGATAGVSGKGTTLANDVAIGSSAKSIGGSGLAIGGNAAALNASTVALGFGAAANNLGDVALGAGSVSAGTIGTASAAISGKSYSFAGGTPTSTVSVGQTGSERTITNVAAGRLSDTSTDAVNGSQLFATNQAVGTLTGNLGSTMVGILGGNAAYDATTGKITGFSQPINGVDTVGAVSAPTNQTTVAGALTALNNNVANTANVAVKYDSATSPGQITLGATGGVLPVGQGAVKITNLAAGTLGASSTDAVNGRQLFTTNQAVASLGTTTAGTLGGGASYGATTGITGFSQAVGPVSSVGAIGGPATFSNVSDALTGLNASLVNTANIAVKYDQPANPSQITLGAIGGTLPAGVSTVKVTNLTAGTLGASSTDAVNGSQLYATNQNVANITSGAAGPVQRTTSANQLALVAVGGTASAPGATQSLTNLADGTVAAGSTDAVSGSQLYATNQSIAGQGTQVTNLGTTIATTLGGSATYDTSSGKILGFSQSINPIDATGAVGAAAAQTTVSGALTALNANALNTANIAVKYDTAGGNTITLGATGGTLAPGASPVKITNLAAGVVSATSRDAVNGAQLNATNEVVTNIASGGLGPVQRTASTNQLALVAPTGSGAAPGATQILTNLASGALSAASTDAVNGSQLHAAGTSIATALGGGASFDASTGKITAPIYTVGGTTYGDVGSALAALGTSVSGGGIKYFHANSTLADSQSTGADSVAIGPAAVANAGNAIALGKGAMASGTSSIAIGTGNKVTGIGSGAIGDPNIVVGAGSYAVGNNNTVANANSFVVGSGVTTTQDNSVVLGNKSSDRAAVAVTGTAINGTTYSFAGVGASANGVVSVGSVGAERQIVNVAAGTVSATSTDAVNGSQLYATNQAVGTLGAQVNTLTVNVANGAVGPVQRTGTANQLALVAPDGTGAAPEAAQTLTNLAAGKLSSASTDAVNGGQLYATNQAINGIQNGGGIKYFHANSTAADSQAVGVGSVAAGPQSVATGSNSVALGNGAAAANANDVALGSGSTTVAAVGTASGTVNGTVYTYAGATPSSTVSVGSAGSERTVTNVAAGRVNATSTDAVNGSQLFATNSAVTSLATGLGTGGQNAVRYDLDGTGQKTNTVTLQGGDPNAPVLIRNVAAGVADSDAANLGQVKAVSSAATTIANGYTDMQVGAALQTAVSYTNQVAAQTLQQANAYTDMRFGQLSQQIGEVQKEARQAAAIGLAASSLRYDERPGKLSAAVGGGTWKGYAAGAMGLGYTSENQRVRANVSATTTGDAWGVGAGLSFTLN